MSSRQPFYRRYRLGWRARRIAVILLALAILWGVRRCAPEWLESPPASSGVQAVAEAYEQRRSGLWVEGSGRVERILSDDREGSPHQRFILRLAGGQTVLVAHNLELSRRVPLGVGEDVEYRGKYEWNERGGVIHWTHHDPQRRRAGGWLRHRDVRYD